ncbi:hypothetical protein [Pontibacter harenae]|uniref:hypothetical protein n=1 Tax=Pontibacter harenae TaxID=2894083 RepID=UPI001E2DD040|nr:hypothetical protein [Pontibacter harenae]MCC9165450.1 hypothetical protein [Pontibacter harenae]
MKKLLSSILLLLSLCMGAQAQTEQAQPARYFIHLNNGQTIYTNKLKYKSPIFKQDYFLVDDTLRYSIQSVNLYQSDEGYFARVSYGSGLDSFAKRVSEGPRISKFYTSTYDYRPNYSPYGFGGYGYGYGAVPSRRRVYFFSKDNGPLIPLNYENLKESLADNASSMALLQRHKRERVISTIVSAVGVGVTAIGVLSSNVTTDVYGNSSAQINPAVYAGAGLIALPFVIKLFQKDKLTQAMEVYNYELKR